MVGTTADFRRPDPWRPLPLNHLPGENRGTVGRIGEVRLSTAGEQEAKLWELRAAASLAQLRRDQGRHAEARELLAPIYGWFTEGFDTPDLKEAKTLLAELT